MTTTIWVRGGESYWLASVAALPGCIASGASRDEAVANARSGFVAYLELLAARGISTDRWKDLDPAAFAVEDGPLTGILPEDLGTLDEHEMRDFLHQVEALRSATLSLVRGTTPDELERRPTESTWSVREALEHVMTAEVTLLSRLERWPQDDGSLPTFQAVHRMAFQRFAVMDPEDTAIDHTVMGRRFSTRKVMRRILEHEFEHQQHIREILSALGSDRPPE